MKHIKLYVKEVSEERRALTFHEECMISIAYHTHRDTISHNVFVKCQQTLYDIGYIKSSYDKRCRIATFHTETTREATPEECLAHHVIEIYETSCFKIKGAFCKSGKCPLKSNNNNLCVMCSEVRDKAKQLLSGKEIYPEVVDE